MSSTTPSASSSRSKEEREYEREIPPIIYDNHTLTFASQRVDHIPMGLWKLYPKTKRLDLSYNRINTMRYIEKFEKLTELILDNNCITERIDFPIMYSLKLLSLNNNRIYNLSDFVYKVQECFPNLIFLSLLCNRACPNTMPVPDHDEADYQRYRLFILHHLPKLKYLDSTPVSSVELMEAKKRGHLLYLRTPRELNEEELQAISAPLQPNTLRNINVPSPTFPRHRGEYLNTELSFANKDSEGNRFILNQDL